MRGKVDELLEEVNGYGITPAHAGKSVKHYPYTGLHEDHPRACGEKVKLLPFEMAGTGSPPRMRGKACDFASK